MDTKRNRSNARPRFSLRSTIAAAMFSIACSLCWAPESGAAQDGRTAANASVSPSDSAKPDGTAKSETSLQPRESPGELDERIAALIEQLGDASFHQRQSAQSELMAIGLPSFEKLRLAASLAPDPEVARAARYLLDSQQVRWSLESDSIQVRDIVEHYNTVDEAGRRTRFQQLAALGTPDALYALVRFARFESDEVLSQFAAMQLIDHVALRLSGENADAPGAMTPETLAELLRSIRESVDQNPRASCVWLSRFSGEAEGLLAGQLPNPNLATSDWELSAKQLAERITTDQRDPSRPLAIEFHFWLGRWLTTSRDRAAGVRCARPVVELVQSGDSKLAGVTSSLLNADLPELAIELAGRHVEEFEATPDLGYLLAEAYLVSGDKAKAEELAGKTSRSIGEYVRDELSAIGPLADADRVEAYRRNYIARRLLSERGLFDWCEREMIAVVDCEVRRREREEEAGSSTGGLPSDMELAGRIQLANFYWEAQRHAEAANTLRPIEQLYATDTFKKDLVYLSQRDDVGAYYNFYAGLAAIDRGDPEAASKHLLESLTFGEREPNPDVVIAYRKIADQEPFKSQYADMLSSMSERFRSELLTLERLYASPTEARVQQRNYRLEVASKCNILAWLLCCCEVQIEESLQLSRRSLELSPDEPAFIDTLARCLYANGKYDAAIRMQKQAIARAPHDRQHKKQLELFIEARRAVEEAE